MIRHNGDLDFTIVATVESHRVEFTVYDIFGWQDGRPVWHRKGSADYMDVVFTLEESEPYLHGTVKWDGCSDWHFDEQERVMLHGCTKADVQRFGDVMAYCWDWAAELLPTWDAGPRI